MGGSGLAPYKRNGNTESGLIQPANANVCVNHEGPSEKGGGCEVLQPSVGNHLLPPQSDMIPSDL